MDPRDPATADEGAAGLVRAGLAHWRAGRMDPAVAALNEACRRAPGEVSVWTTLAECLAAANRPDRALPAWSRALALDARLAFARGEFLEVERRLALLADDARLPEPARADVLLLRARALDQLGGTARAFRAASEGKAIQRRLFAPRAAGREGETEKLARLAAWFEAADSAPWP